MGKIFFILVFLGMVTNFCGCTTTRNATVGVAGYGYLVGKGVTEDTCSTWKAINDIDSWMKKNLW